MSDTDTRKRNPRTKTEDDSVDVDGAPESVESTPTPEGQYTRERLIAEAEGFTGHPPHIVVGAFAHYDETHPGETKPTFTRDEVKQALAAWLGE